MCTCTLGTHSINFKEGLPGGPNINAKQYRRFKIFWSRV